MIKAENFSFDTFKELKEKVNLFLKDQNIIRENFLSFNILDKEALLIYDERYYDSTLSAKR